MRSGSRSTSLKVAWVATGLLLVAGAVGIQAAQPAEAAPATTALHLTTPRAGHAYRHGAVPRVLGRVTASGLHSLRTHAAGTASTSSRTLTYLGGFSNSSGITNIGVSGQPQIYLVFMGNQWGTQSTTNSGNYTYNTFSGDSNGVAVALQKFVAGLGTNSEAWSNIITQYCNGAATGASTCTPGNTQIPYPSGSVLKGTWYDNSASATSVATAGATGNQLAQEAENAATNFGLTTQAQLQNVQFLIASPHGTDPDGWLSTTTGYCAYHDYTSDPTIDGGGAVSGPVAAFTNMPYLPDAGSSCGQNIINTNGSVDGVTIVESHEYAETMTDFYPATGWYNSTNGEIGDECAWITSGAGAIYNLTTSTGTYPVQGQWSNTANSCVQNAASVYNYPPSITSFSPTSAAVGSSVTITGQNLTGATGVTFNGLAGTVTSSSLSAVVARVPTGASTGVIAVTTPTGTATSTSKLTITVPAPTITSFTPTSGPTGTSVTVTGTNLSGATKITFNGATGKVSSSTATTVVGVVPTGASTGKIAVTTTGGTATSSSSFTVLAAPTITSFTPTSGMTGTSVTLTGTGLTGARSVTFNGVAGTVTSSTSTSAVVVVPAGASTGRIAVTTANGTGTSSSSFTFVAAPTITSFTPTIGVAGTTVTITGTNLSGATKVAFNGTSATISSDTSTKITTKVPTGATNGPITVTPPGGTATSSTFTI